MIYSQMLWWTRYAYTGPFLVVEVCPKMHEALFLRFRVVLQVYYWTKIRKTKRLYLPSRRVVEKDVAPIVADYVVRARSVTAAVEKFEQYVAFAPRVPLCLGSLTCKL